MATKMAGSCSLRLNVQRSYSAYMSVGKMQYYVICLSNFVFFAIFFIIIIILNATVSAQYGNYARGSLKIRPEPLSCLSDVLLT